MLAFALTALLVAGRAEAGSAPDPSPLAPPPVAGAYVPDAADRAAHDVAAATLAGDLDALDSSLHRLTALDRAHRADDGRPTGLLPFALAAAAADVPDPDRWHEALRRALARKDIDPALRSELRQELEDDPLRLANHRLDDARDAQIARVFNAIVEPIGRSILSLPLAPYRLGVALLGLAVTEHLQEPIDVPERQALAHWKDYVERYPDTPEARPLVPRIAALQVRWNEMERDRAVHASKDALGDGRPRLALVLADRALDYAPSDDTARELARRAAARIAIQAAHLRESLTASAEPPADLGDPQARALDVALLLPHGHPAMRAEALLRSAPSAPVADAARFADAIARGEAGDDTDMCNGLQELADRGPRRSAMARHARALLDDPAENPYAAFQTDRRRDRLDRLGWIALGPLSHGVPDLRLPRPVEWLVTLPSLVGVVGNLPNRLARAFWRPPTADAAAVDARRYLTRFPNGKHADEVRNWLVGFDKDSGDWIDAEKVASAAPHPDAPSLADLREHAAEQALKASKRQRRLDMRLAMLDRTIRQYPRTKAGHEAGLLMRKDLEDATAQHIRISRDFLRENPRVAGPEGLGLRPGLLDGDLSNGELHPQGVTLLGGRTIEIALVGPSGDEKAPPELVRRTLSEERLARLVAVLDETARRNALLDPDAELAPDADRDLFFERARLGVANRPDARPGAASDFAFLGMRERYGMVRKRESILPFDFVIQGTFPDLGLGAFPRMRMPKSTPDAILYR